MTFPAIIAASSPPINLPTSTVKRRITCSSDSSSSFTLRNPSNLRSSRICSIQQIRAIKATASDSTAIVDDPTVASTSEEDEIQAKVGARVRVTVPLKVYHVAKVPEVDLNGKEGKLKEYVAVWKGKRISANLPCKIEFFEVLEGRGDAPVKFFAHLKEDEFEFID